ncbi:MAG: GDSL-type esterase/lipase family protein [Xanthobacteraceae bacterium]
MRVAGACWPAPHRRGVLRLAAAAAASVPSGRGSPGMDNPVHVVLLGDSIFDNASYVGAGPDVTHQLRDLMGNGSRVSLNARDGATLADIERQLLAMPRGATHLVISAGGNDALIASGVLDAPAHSVADALDKLQTIAQGFRGLYGAMLARIMAWKIPCAVCTIYDPRFPEPDRRRAATAALALLNDSITREAFSNGANLLDLRLICGEDEDFANAIEPSVIGGSKIAHAIRNFVRGDNVASVVLAR